VDFQKYDWANLASDFGTKISADELRGKVLLVVNVASRCGFTPQYKGLQEIYEKFRDRGFVVLAFPCNQFGLQEPGTNQEIANFCETIYHVTFPVMKKVNVNGGDSHPLYKDLKAETPGLAGKGPILWNFTKFLVDRSGQVVKRFAPTRTPESIASEIEKLL
jgi:glutathione peroxidase